MSLHTNHPECEDKVKLPTTDLEWTSYHSVQELLDELNDCTNRLRKNDLSYIEKLKVLFLPTGDLQDISISSGWGQEYLTIAERFDKEVGMRLSRRHKS